MKIVQMYFGTMAGLLLKLTTKFLNAFGWVTRRHTSLKNENCHLLALTVLWNTKKNVWKEDERIFTE